MPVLEKIYIANTVENAIQTGLNELNLNEKQVKIEVINPGKKGFFGLGKSNAEVKLVIIDPELKKLPSISAIQNRTKEDIKSCDDDAGKIVVEKAEIASESEKTLSVNQDDKLNKQQSKENALMQVENYIVGIIHEMGLNITANSAIKNSSEVLINLESSDAARIIGKRGQVLNSLQLLAQNYYNHIEKGYTTVTLDIENYREKRKETLQNLALNMSKKAVATRKPVKFEPMPNYERKIMHQILTNIENIETYSEGREPHRYLVIKAR